MGFINRLMGGSLGIAKSTIAICMKKDDDDQIYRTYFGTEPARLSVGMTFRMRLRLIFSSLGGIENEKSLCEYYSPSELSIQHRIFWAPSAAKWPIRLNLLPELNFHILSTILLYKFENLIHVIPDEE